MDNELPYSSFSVSGDFDKDGDLDALSFEKASHNIHYNETTLGSRCLSRKAGTDFDSIGSGQIRPCGGHRFDQDGDLDAVVSFIASGQILWFENNQTGADLGTLTLVTDPFNPNPRPVGRPQLHF